MGKIRGRSKSRSVSRNHFVRSARTEASPTKLNLKSKGKLIRSLGIHDDPKLRLRTSVLVTDIFKEKEFLSSGIIHVQNGAPLNPSPRIPDSDVSVMSDRATDDPTYPMDSHSNRTNSDEDLEDVPAGPSKTTSFKCQVCQEHADRYKLHLQWHQEKGQFFCTLCNFVCFQREHLNVHQKNHAKDLSHEESSSDSAGGHDDESAWIQ